MKIEEMIYLKEKSGYSLSQISEECGIPVATLQKIFSGETLKPRQATKSALERAMEKIAHVAMHAEEGMIGKREAASDGGKKSIKDYYALPEEKRVELIDGVFYDLAAPTVGHQRGIMSIWKQIDRYIEDKNGDCEALVAPLDVQLNEDEYTMVQPDLMVVCDRKKLKARGIVGAPDMVVEVLSPSTRHKDISIKTTIYKSAGVREYWIVDLDRKRTMTYCFENDDFPRLYATDELIPVGIYGGELQIRMTEIYEKNEQLQDS